MRVGKKGERVATSLARGNSTRMLQEWPRGADDRSVGCFDPEILRGCRSGLLHAAVPPSAVCR